MEKIHPLPGMFAGLYASQLRNWLQVFDPSQFVVVPMDCYTAKGPSEVLRLVGEAAGLTVGKSLGDLDRSFRQARLTPTHNLLANAFH
jgi:hypothetical protein